MTRPSRPATHLVLVAALAAPAVVAGCGPPAGSGARTPGGGGASVRHVVDMRGVHVALPGRLERVATIDDGFVESVMTRLGVIRLLVATGSGALNTTFSYRLPSASGADRLYEQGRSTMLSLHPWLASLPCVSAPGGSDILSYESLAAARPDVVILRVGDCTLRDAAENTRRAIATIEALGVPVVVLRAPMPGDGPNAQLLRRELLVLGDLFGRPREAAALADDIEAAEAVVRGRTRDVPAASRPRALYLGLAAHARQAGGAALVWGVDTPESRLLEDIVGARNAYRGRGYQVLLNAEQILALDPDVIFLPTAAGYHPSEELYESPAYRLLRELTAVRNRRVYALPWTPDNCARRIEYPIELMVMAKGAYPERFADVAVHQWILDFYRRTYGVDEQTARQLRSDQWLDWTVQAGF